MAKKLKKDFLVTGKTHVGMVIICTVCGEEMQTRYLGLEESGELEGISYFVPLIAFYCTECDDFTPPDLSSLE